MLGLQFVIDDIPFTNIEIAKGIVNTNKNIHPVSAVTKLTDHDIPLTHLAKEPARKPSEILSIRHTRTIGEKIPISGSLGVKPNIVPDSNSWFVANEDLIFHPSSNILLTNCFNDLGEPLFWRHEIPLASIAKGVTITDIQGNIVSNALYKTIIEVDPTSATHESLQGIVAHNFSFNRTENKIYIIAYKDADNNIVQEILNEKPLFVQVPDLAIGATGTLNADGSLLIYWRNEVAPSINVSGFEFAMPDGTTRTAFREHRTSFIGGLLPSASISNEPWFLNVPNFHWILVDGNRLVIPEWHSQNFYPSAPITTAEEDVGTVVGKNIIQVSNVGILKQSPENLVSGVKYIDVLVYQESSESASLALTNDSSKVGLIADSISSIVWQYDNLSVIHDQAIIYTNFDLTNYSWVKASYAYSSYYYSASNIDLNMFRNPSLRGRTVVFYLVPNFLGQTNAIEWLIHDEDLIIVDMSQDGTTGNPAIEDSILGNYYSLPEGLESIKHDSNGLGLQFMIGKVFLEDYADYYILGEIAFPETLDESPVALITDVRDFQAPSVYELIKANPDRLALLSDSYDISLLAMPALINVQEVRMHWGLFSDYNPYAFISKDEMETRLDYIVEAGTEAVITEDGIPWMDIKNIDYDNKTVTIEWHPVPMPTADTVVAGKLMTGSAQDNLSLLTAIADLSKITEHTVSIGAGNTLYMQIYPSIDVGGDTYSGPNSNLIKFSFNL